MAMRKRTQIAGLIMVGLLWMFAGCGQEALPGEPEPEKVIQTEQAVTEPETDKTEEVQDAEAAEDDKQPEAGLPENDAENAQEEQSTAEADGSAPVYGAMPLLMIETEKQAKVSETDAYTSCTVSVENCEEAWNLSDAPAGIRVRGNSTKMYTKKPYRIKFEEKTQLLGLSEGAHKSWVLLAEFNDPSLLRNYMTYCFAEDLSGISYVTDCALTEVYLNGEYLGVYLLAEQIQVDEQRINIDETGVKDPTIVDAGYLLELEADNSRRAEEGKEGEAWFAVTGYAAEEDRSMQMLLERSFDEKAAYYVVKSDARSPEQMAYIKEYMINVYDAVYKEKTEEAVAAYVDLDSAVDMYLVQLIANDFDNNYSSMYLYKDAGGKLMFGAPWDFDLAYGNFNGYTEAKDTVYVYHLLRTLGEYDWFRELTEQRYQELSTGENSPIARMKLTVTELTERYAEEFAREYKRWREDLVSMGGFGGFGGWEAPEGAEGFGGFGNFGGWELPEGAEGFGGFGTFDGWEPPEGAEDFGGFGTFDGWEMPEGAEGFGGFGNFGGWKLPEGAEGFGGFGNFGGWEMPEGAEGFGGFGNFGGFGDMGNFSYGSTYDTHQEAADALRSWLTERLDWVAVFLQGEG